MHVIYVSDAWSEVIREFSESLKTTFPMIQLKYGIFYCYWSQNA